MIQPRADGREAARAATIALDDAGVELGEIDYVNAHASSTPLGDVAEAHGIALALGERATTVPVSDTKALYGHPLGASGAIEAAIRALAIQDSWAPASVNLVNPDPEAASLLCRLFHAAKKHPAAGRWAQRWRAAWCWRDIPSGDWGDERPLPSARQVALGGRSSESADPGEQLALGERTALLDLDPPLAAVVLVVGADAVREVLDNLAVADQQQVVDRQRVGDLIEEGPHVFVAMAFVALTLLGGWSSG